MTSAPDPRDRLRLCPFVVSGSGNGQQWLAMREAAAKLYFSVGVELVFAEPVSLVATWALNLSVGRCRLEDGLSDEQAALFGMRIGVGPRDVALYMVGALYEPMAGCSRHPPNEPSIAIALGYAGQWTLAHELGHIFGLSHTSGFGRLMTGNGTDGLPADVRPILTEEEERILRLSPWLQTP